MKFFQALGKWFTWTCIYFTLFAAPITLIGILISSNPHETIRLGVYMLLLPAAACISAAGVALSGKRVPRWLRILGHYIITLVAVLVFVWMPSNPSARQSDSILMFALFSILYWLLFGFVHLIRGRVKRLLEETSK